ncbi:DNA-binding FadR family transcriptional regulator [Rhizobium paknamense]|uniref:DNA-binding FadR family transcriptional regulator n=2 Tax=Rhizobium paknamense TaxID=1206817 RepID=A0ABU0ICC6_9HYPH|nr:DNA-binding FadR family transcriptional regulator [Rhizobium paknamense]
MADWLSAASPISRKNAAEVVFDDIRSAITSGRLAVGTRLPSEAHLAGRYGVSRPIVREALRSLQTLGLTQTRTGSGTFVVMQAPGKELTYGHYSARDLVEARPCVEVPAAGLAAERRSTADVQKLLSLCDRMDREEDPHKWVVLDWEFHKQIAQASGNAVFAKIVSDVREALTEQSELVNFMAPRRIASNLEHRRIAEAIEAGSPEAARAAMDAHLIQVRDVVSRITGGEEGG